MESIHHVNLCYDKYRQNHNFLSQYNKNIIEYKIFNYFKYQCYINSTLSHIASADRLSQSHDDNLHQSQQGVDEDVGVEADSNQVTEYDNFANWTF